MAHAHLSHPVLSGHALRGTGAGDDLVPNVKRAEVESESF